MAPVLRLDYNQPPPVDLFSLRGLDLLPPLVRAQKIADAWDGYKHRHDPPGLAVWSTTATQGDIKQEVWVFSGCDDSDAIDWFMGIVEARSAAWAWHDLRHKFASRLTSEAGIVAEYFHADGDAPTSGDECTPLTSTRTPVVNARLAEFLGQPHVLGDDEYAAASADELMERGVLQFEGDPPIEREPLSPWPLILRWTNTQVAEVERWLVDSTAEIPEVLRAA